MPTTDPFSVIPALGLRLGSSIAAIVVTNADGNCLSFGQWPTEKGVSQ